MDGGGPLSFLAPKIFFIVAPLRLVAGAGAGVRRGVAGREGGGFRRRVRSGGSVFENEMLTGGYQSKQDFSCFWWPLEVGSPFGPAFQIGPHGPEQPIHGLRWQIRACLKHRNSKQRNEKNHRNRIVSNVENYRNKKHRNGKFRVFGSQEFIT